ncbi:MAG: NUDIX hydrolase [Leptolyngbya sp. SIO3F4]|nr:NUDIX hydrolase [Leptolyngbya sp. SIO3F4]
MKQPIPRKDFKGIIQHPGSAVVLAFDQAQRLMLVEVPRQEWEHAVSWELPGGVREAEETFEQAAHRECLEETGYRLGQTEKLLEYQIPVGYANEVVHFFTAPIGELSTQIQPEHTVVFLSLSEVAEWMQAGKIQDGQTLLGVLFYLQFKRHG